MRRRPRPTASALAILGGCVGVSAGIGCENDAVPDSIEPGAPSPPPTEPSPARPGPSSARWDVMDLLRAGRDAAQQLHPSDGGGRAWLEPTSPEKARSGVPQRFELTYEAGPLGIATGGAILLQVSPYWGWSTPQLRDPDAPGYTVIRTNPPDLRVRAETSGEQQLRIEVTGRALVEGDRLRITYGAGEGPALPDRYAERSSTFWFGVDGDGDGVRKLLEESPTIDVEPGAPVRLRAVVPSVVRPGESFPIRLALLDRRDNAGSEALLGAVEFLDPPEGVALPERVAFRRGDEGRIRAEGKALVPGRYRLRARFGDFEAESNPLVVTEAGPRVFWGDLHGHSNFSDGTGRPDDYFRYARDVSGLDIVSLTDHDHWGMEPLVERPDRWRRIQEETLRFHEPGRFVTLLGFEWTNWIYGHRHVLYFEDTGPMIDSVAEATDHPTELWEALGDASALTVAHHPAGGPVPIDWEVPPDPRFEPVVEIVSVHGSSEAADSPNRVRNPVDGHYARDALERGYRLGFVGSGDLHNGHPGSHGRDPVNGGLAAILAADLTRASVLEALRSRRVYATNGPRIVLRAALGGTGMGGTLRVPSSGPEDAPTLYLEAVGTAEFARVDLIRSGGVVDSLEIAPGERWVRLHRPIGSLRPGEYLYLRVLQVDGGAAWTSPIFVDPP